MERLSAFTLKWIAPEFLCKWTEILVLVLQPSKTKKTISRKKETNILTSSYNFQNGLEIQKSLQLQWQGAVWLKPSSNHLTDSLGRLKVFNCSLVQQRHSPQLINWLKRSDKNTKVSTCLHEYPGRLNATCLRTFKVRFEGFFSETFSGLQVHSN